jgi:hypothetical protein
MADQLDISALTNDIYVSADIVGRELNGFIPSVTMNAESSQASKGDTIKAAFTRVASAENIVERMDMQEADNSLTIDSKTLTLDKARRVQIPLGGEDTRQLQNTGQYASVYGDLITQAMRTLANEIEVEIATNLKQGAHFASGTAGTTPFAVGSNESGVEELLEARRILVDDGMPTNDVAAVLNTTAGANLRSNLKLLDQSFSNSGSLREQGILIPIAGINLRESGNISTHTKGTLGSSPLTDVTDAVDATSIAVNGGTGTILVGDAVQFGGAGNVHIVGTGTSDASGGTITLNAGLKEAVANDTAVAIAANYLPSFVFHRNAVELAMRAPAMPLGGDMASESITVQDPHSGLVFQVSTYRGYHKSLIEVTAVYGVKVWKGEFVHTILG